MDGGLLTAEYKNTRQAMQRLRDSALETCVVIYRHHRFLSVFSRLKWPSGGTEYRESADT